MSRNKRRGLINQANALKSTGPRTPEGKQRSRMNAFKHNLSGNHLILQEHEHKAYHELTANMLRDLKPQTEPERQIAQKIIDLNFRINRITSIENNMLNIDMMNQTTSAPHDDRTEIMVAQTRAWKEDAKSFDLLGRYEGRLSKQLLQYQHELERMQNVRRAEAQRNAPKHQQQPTEPKQAAPLNPDLASFGDPLLPFVMTAASEPRLMRNTMPPEPLRVPEAA